MKLRAIVIALGLVAAACGGSSDTTDAAATTAPTTPAPTTTAPTTSTVGLTTTQVPASSTTTTTQPAGTTEPNRALDRSILSLALAAGDTGPGRFRLQRGPNTETLMTVDGRYWVTDGGNVLTALDVDTTLIASEMATLVATLEGYGGQPPDSPHLASLRDHYQGDQFQIGLTDLVRSLAVGGLPAEWAEQWAWFIQADGNPVPPELTACGDAVAVLDVAAREWVHNLEIEFTDGTWTFPVEQFEADLASEIEAAAICESFVAISGPSAEIVMELSDDGERRRLDVLVDDKTYTDREPELAFAVIVLPDDAVGAAPAPDATSLLTMGGSYLVAISVCEELPWIYSNFAAGDNYYGPGSDGYYGPTVLDSGWLCEDEVPADRRDG